MKTLIFALLAMLITVPESDAKALKHPKRKVASESSRSGGKIHVMPLDPDFPVDELEDDDVLIDRGGRPKGGLPPLLLQRRMLREAGLAEVGGWEPVEHDLFFGIVGESEWEYVMRKYGDKFPETRLRKLRELIRAYHEQEEQ
jgi:hypothetical protein